MYQILEEDLSGVSADDLANMINGVNLKDPNQLAVAVNAFNVVMGGEKTTTPFRNIYPTTRKQTTATTEKGESG